jgi:hypothetical protein
VTRVRVRIVGTDLPGRMFEDHTNVHIGVQCRREVVDITPADADTVVFEFEINAVDGDFRGPYVHGRRGERFLYLNWVDVGAGGTPTGFRRAKLQLDALAGPAGAVEAQLRLTDERGGPRCASVRPPHVRWRVTG